MEEVLSYEVPNHTQTPNELFDEHMKTLKGSELKVLLCICRKTFGWHKVKDEISLSQIQEMTGLDRKTVIAATASLMARGLVARRKKGMSFEYALILSTGLSTGGKIPLVDRKNFPYSKGGKQGKNSTYKRKGNKYTNIDKENKNYMDDPYANFIED